MYEAVIELADGRQLENKGELKELLAWCDKVMFSEKKTKNVLIKFMKEEKEKIYE